MIFLKVASNEFFFPYPFLARGQTEPVNIILRRFRMTRQRLEPAILCIRGIAVTIALSPLHAARMRCSVPQQTILALWYI